MVTERRSRLGPTVGRSNGLNVSMGPRHCGRGTPGRPGWVLDPPGPSFNPRPHAAGDCCMCKLIVQSDLCKRHREPIHSQVRNR